MQIGVITNPNSRKNKGRSDRAAQLQNIVGNLGEVHQTQSVDSIKPILREFLRKRATYWVADGGDGALHWMLRSTMEVLEEDEFADESVTLPLTMPTNGGTIDFVANNVGLRGSAESLLARLRSSIERGHHIEEIEVDSMLIDGIEIVDGEEVPFRTYGFASATGGVGQRFFSKYAEAEDPNPGTIVGVFAKALASMPVALTPLRSIPGMPKMLRNYAREMFAPAEAKITLDGMILPDNAFTGVHIASMSIDLGGVVKFFGQADQTGMMNAIIGTASPLRLVRNIPRMHLGKEMVGRDIIDRPCREMVIEATGDELLAPVIDGEFYRNTKKMTFKLGPRIRIPKVVNDK